MDNKQKQEIIELFNKLIKPRDDRLNNLSRLGKVLLVKDGNTQSLQAQTANNEIADNVKFIESYGFTAKPKPNSECVLLNLQGNAGNVVALVIGNREFRFKTLKDGEVAMYDDSGNLLHFKNGGNIDFQAPATINQTAPTIIIKGANNVTVETQTAMIKAQTATIDAEQTTTTGKTSLAGGDFGVALLGCEVEVDPLTHKGKITSASTEVTAK